MLGAQAVGHAGVDKRIDVMATALRGRMTVDDLAELELAYAPPFGSAKDPINMAAFLAQNVLDGTLTLWSALDAESMLDGSVLLLDVRSQAEYERGHLPGAINVPHTEIRERLDEVLTHGVDSASLDGGMHTLTATRPHLVLVEGAEDGSLVAS